MGDVIPLRQCASRTFTHVVLERALHSLAHGAELAVSPIFLVSLVGPDDHRFKECNHAGRRSPYGR